MESLLEKLHVNHNDNDNKCNSIEWVLPEPMNSFIDEVHDAMMR